MRTRSLGIVQIYVPTFILTYSIGNVVRIKMPLKYGIHIQFASCCNCTSVVTPLGIFMFHRCFFVYTRYFVRTCMERDKCSLPKTIMTLQFFQLMLCYCLLPSQFPPRHQPMTWEMPSSVGIGRTPPCFAVGNICLHSSSLFSNSSFFALAFIVAQTAVAAALSLSLWELNHSRFLRLLGKYIVSYMFSEIIVVRIRYIMT